MADWIGVDMAQRICTVEDCLEPHKARGMCSTHYWRWRKHGDPEAPNIRRWAVKGGPCDVCGAAVAEGSGRRKHCSGACQAVDSYWKGNRPAEAQCDFCGKSFPLANRSSAGKLSRTNLAWCPDCLQTPNVQRYRRYGVTKERYEAAMAAGCSICHAAADVLHIDHDHACCPAGKKSCGKCVRGFLCGPCNRGIGLFFDDPDALRRAADYLTEWRQMP